MYQPFIFFIGLRYLRGRSSDKFARLVTWLSSIGITLGVTAMIMLLSVMNGFDREQKNIFLKLIPQAIITSSSGSMTVNQSVKDQFNHWPGVQKTVPITTGEVVLQSQYGLGLATMLGINSDDNESLMQYHPINEAQLLPGQYGVIIGENLAHQLKLTLHDKVRILVTNAGQLTPMGRIPSQRLFTVQGFFSSGGEADATQILINQQDASRLMRYPEGEVTGLRLFLEDPFAVNTLSQRPLPDGLLWQDWRIKKGDLFQAIKMEKNMMGLLISLIIIVAIFNIVTSLSLMVMDKQKEVAILQTIGLSRIKTMLIFMIQGASSGIIGALVGLGLGTVLTDNINLFIPLHTGLVLPTEIDPIQLMVIVLATMILSLISTLYPSWRAATIQPAEALRYE